MSKANDRQVGGNHYVGSIQHWDVVVANDLDYFQAQITKYVIRWKNKNGLQDLKKAQHFLEKYIELAEASPDEVGYEYIHDNISGTNSEATNSEATPHYIDQDRR